MDDGASGPRGSANRAIVCLVVDWMQISTVAGQQQAGTHDLRAATWGVETDKAGGCR
jgi:hypothetical protein